MPHISIISPVYNAENILSELVTRIETSVKSITTDYEIILVEDCGPDKSWEKILELSQGRSYLKGIKLSRNFGQHYAISCGLDHAKGDWIVVMDCDLQDQPEEIVNLYAKAKQGFDIVLASRAKRKDSFFKKLFSKTFYRTLGYLTGTEQDETVANFGIYNLKVIETLIRMKDSIRYFPAMVKWVGFKSIKLDVEHAKREEGKSNYNFKKLMNLALDIILAFSDKPLRLVVKAGLFISFISIIITVFYFFKWLKGDVVVLGFTSLIISIWLLSGVIISTLGIIGLYVGKIFEGVKGRPVYIISNTTDS
ncbi:glycosyltransferase family 2 protein [Psychroflexus tropicus]|uniref:glycosyltransferase family 2 protein n=1 Tax=Psychroflexus tropicus TaxID=197345 RepID=UPI0003790336|nr:glycosyltransferase family 2 protein [Psychroflexus tropicus]